jgi:hypothetical protein
MPDLIRLLFDADAMKLAAARLIEETKFDGGRMFRKKREVYAFTIPVGA